MPALRNHRQEAFCQLVKRRVPKLTAYVQAGYNYNEGAPYRLAGNVRVKARIAEITRHIAVKTRVTVESITQELDAVRDGATAAAQYGPAQQAIVTKAKLHGLLIERKEAGSPGDFASLDGPEAVVAKLRAELGDRLADELQASLRQVEEQPTRVEPAKPVKVSTPDRKLN